VRVKYLPELSDCRQSLHRVYIPDKRLVPSPLTGEGRRVRVKYLPELSDCRQPFHRVHIPDKRLVPSPLTGEGRRVRVKYLPELSDCRQRLHRVHIPDVHHLGLSADSLDQPCKHFSGPDFDELPNTLPYHEFHAALPLYAAAELFQ